MFHRKRMTHHCWTRDLDTNNHNGEEVVTPLHIKGMDQVARVDTCISLVEMMMGTGQSGCRGEEMIIGL